LNILLVVLDTARRDALEPYGAPPGTTPAIAQLAARGCAVDQAYVTSSWTLPSHASMFTGLLPRELGLTQAPAGSPQSARPAFEQVSERMLGQVLSDAGYATHAWTTNLWASPVAGLDIGFDSFEYINSGRDERMNNLLGSGRRAELAWAAEGLRSRSDDGAADVGVRLRHSIDDWSGQPTFWFVNLSECHSPYLPPRPWNDLAAHDRMRAALDVKRYLSFLSICLQVARREDLPAGPLARMRHLYERSISYMDSWLADVLERLDARGILDDTLVIVTSDHGENFGEDGLLAHGFSLDQRLINVPLVIAGPGLSPIDRVTSLAELPRVIAETAGLESHPYGAEALPAGVAVSQYDPMAPADDRRIVDFATTHGLDDAAVRRLCCRLTAVTDGDIKLVLRDGEELIYDLKADPGETAPVDPSTLNGQLSKLREPLKRSDVLETSATPAAASDRPETTEDEVAAIERQMKLLGYM
jgi:arylsulfatase A-like enzyme